MSDWTDELREEVIKAYEEANPTPETSVEIVKELADEYEKTPNGIRMVLTKAGVYVKKEPTKSSSNGEKKSGGTRVSKADALEQLTNAIQSAGLEVDDAIVSKLTGKAALYFAELINNAVEK